MKTLRKSNVALSRKVALHADRALLAGGNKLVYVLVADKKLRYTQWAFSNCLRRDYQER